jgi:site-specific recombinase XerD
MEARKNVDHVLRVYRRWRERRRIAPGLERGVLASWWDDLVSFLAQRGDAWYTAHRIIEISKPFATWAESLGVRDAAGISEKLVERYLRSDRCPREGPRFLRLLLIFLRERKIVTGRNAVSRPSRIPAIIKEYLQFLRDHRGTGAGTVEQHRRYIESLLEMLGMRTVKKLRGLTVAEIQRFITERAAGLSRSGRRGLCAAIRSFLRFLYLRGYIAVDLMSAVPVIPSFKLERLPPTISIDAIERILGAINRSSPVGRRDYAMLLLLATYGMRAGQIYALRLEDIAWRRGVLKIPGAKGGRDVILPIQSAVGEAIVDYLKRGRPVGWSFRQVFLRVRGPIGPLKGTLANTIRTYARKAGVDLPSSGSHAWRHACATRMLAKGQSLKTIRDVLGHESIDTTFIYTKVDLSSLRKAALDWPEVAE